MAWNMRAGPGRPVHISTPNPIPTMQFPESFHNPTSIHIFYSNPPIPTMQFSESFHNPPVSAYFTPKPPSQPRNFLFHNPPVSADFTPNPLPTMQFSVSQPHQFLHIFFPSHTPTLSTSHIVSFSLSVIYLHSLPLLMVNDFSRLRSHVYWQRLRLNAYQLT